MIDKLLKLHPEGYIMGGLINGFIVMPDKGCIFLPYDPMRQFRPKDEIGKEIEALIAKHAEQTK